MTRVVSLSDRFAGLHGPGRSLGLLGIAVAVPAAFLGWTLSPPGLPLTLAVLSTGMVLAVWGMASHYPHGRLGGCNVVTTVRLAMVAALSAVIVGPSAGMVPGWAVAILACATLSLDGFDGWLARRQGLSSAFGARFDMEVDSALAAVLSLALLAHGRAGVELILLGGARYAFVAASLFLPWLGAALPDSFRRKAVCVVQIGVLAVFSAPILSDGVARPLAVAAAVLVAWSFWRDIRWLVAQR